MSLQTRAPVSWSSQSEHILCAGVPFLPGSHTHTHTQTCPCTHSFAGSARGRRRECAGSLELFLRVSVSPSLPLSHSLRSLSQRAEEEGKAERPGEVWRHDPSSPGTYFKLHRSINAKRTRSASGSDSTGGTPRLLIDLSLSRRCVQRFLPGPGLKGLGGGGGLLLESGVQSGRFRCWRSDVRMDGACSRADGDLHRGLIQL